MSALRKNFPERPIAAFTASATQQVRHDIIESTGAADPGQIYRQLSPAESAIFRAGMQRAGTARTASAGAENVSRQQRDRLFADDQCAVEETVELLKEQGIKAIGYHGKMTTEQRTRESGALDVRRNSGAGGHAGVWIGDQ